MRIFIELNKIFTLWRFNLKSELAMRQSFLLLTVGMIINDLAFVIVWVFFFMRFGTVNGWQAVDVIGLQAMVTMVYGLGFFFGGGANKLTQQIDSGYFDTHLLTPGNLYLKLFANHIRTSALGDILYGLITTTVFFIMIKAGLVDIMVWILCLIPATIILCNYNLIAGMIGFLVTDASYLAGSLLDVLVGSSTYPSGTYNEFLRFCFVFVIPSIVIGGLPVEIIKNHSYELVFLIWAIAIFWVLLAVFLLKKAIKRYESANLLANRV